MEKFRKSSFGKLPAALRKDPRIPKRAGHLFAVMGSYGPESRAGLERLAEDIEAKIPTVRKLQKILVEFGWMILLSEGQGAGKKGEGKPRDWWLNDYPFQHQLDQSTKEEVSKLRFKDVPQGIPLKAEGIPIEGSPKGTPYTDNLHTDNKSEHEFLNHRQAVGIFKKQWSASHDGRQYIVTGRDHGALKKLLENKLAPDFFEAKIMGYLKNRDPFILEQAHSISLCCSQFNKWLIYEPENSSGKSLSDLGL